MHNTCSRILSGFWATTPIEEYFHDLLAPKIIAFQELEHLCNDPRPHNTEAVMEVNDM